MTNLKNVRLRRTRQSTIFEIVAALCSLFSWIIVSIAVAKGRLGAEKFITISVLSLLSTFMFYSAYRPGAPWIRNSYQPKTMQQLIATSKFFRILGLEISILCLCIAVLSLIKLPTSIDKILGTSFMVIFLGTKIYIDRKYKEVKKVEKAVQKKEKQ